MTPTELDEFAASYFHDWELLRGGSRAERLALEHAADRPSETLPALLLDDPTKPDVAWPIILYLIEHAPDDAALAFVAAGPLEDLIQRHGLAVGDQIVDQARRDPRLRQGLGDVSGWERVPEPLRGRLQKLANPKI